MTCLCLEFDFRGGVRPGSRLRRQSVMTARRRIMEFSWSWQLAITKTWMTFTRLAPLVPVPATLSMETVGCQTRDAERHGANAAKPGAVHSWSPKPWRMTTCKLSPALKGITAWLCFNTTRPNPQPYKIARAAQLQFPTILRKPKEDLVGKRAKVERDVVC